MRPCQGRVPCPPSEFKTSRVGVQKCSLLIVGFAVTVTIWPREVVSCRDFIFEHCRYFLGHVACRNLPLQGLIYHSVNLSSLNEYLTSHCNLRLCSFLLFSLSFTCIVVVYIICGILINIYIRHIEGKEAFPNYLFWVDVPFLVKV